MGGNHLYDCNYCEQNPYFFSVLGHDGPPQGMWDKNLVSDEPLILCPRRTLLTANEEALREVETHRVSVFPLWKKGLLLHPGSAGEQPARELAILTELDRMNNRADEKYIELTAEPDGPEGEL